jgi:hemolysin activation/secretion protein
MLAGGRYLIAILAIVGVSATATAQPVPPSAQPGRERERFVDPPAPRAQPGGTITLPSTVAPDGADAIRLTVRGFKIVGSTIYGEPELTPLYADLIGQEISLAAIYDLARRITAKYGADGYVLSRAIVPPQNLARRGAVIRIQVVEGYIDAVEWPMVKLARYRDFFTDYTAKIIAERPANIRTLERYLLLANDLPGLKFATSLRPSKTNPNASTLVVEVVEKTIDAMARVDNRGSPARGPYQYLGSVTLNNILGAHEAFTATWAGTFQFEELQYFAAGYKQVLTSEGLIAFVNASYGFGRPGNGLQELQYKTKSTIVEAGLSYPVIRLRERNLTLTALGYMTNDNGSFFDDPNTPPSTGDRIRGVRFKAEGDFADSLFGINQLSLVLSQGILGLDSTTNDNPLRSTKSGRVDFTKLEGTLSRLQPLGHNFSLFVAGYGQYAAVPLLVSEQCGYGGRFFGRAFDPSQLLGDHCWQVIGELRYDVPTGIKDLTRSQLYVFADHGRVYNIDPDVDTPKTQHGTSVGGGVRLAWQDTFSADLSVAKAVDGPRDDWRFFFILAAKR